MTWDMGHGFGLGDGGDLWTVSLESRTFVWESDSRV